MSRRSPQENPLREALQDSECGPVYSGGSREDVPIGARCTRSTGPRQPIASEVGDGVKGRTEAPEDGESLRPTATPRPCGHRASFRPYRRAATGNGATARSEAPALRKLPGTATPIRLPLPRQSPTLLRCYSKTYIVVIHKGTASSTSRSSGAPKSGPVIRVITKSTPIIRPRHI